MCKMLVKAEKQIAKVAIPFWVTCLFFEFFRDNIRDNIFLGFD